MLGAQFVNALQNKLVLEKSREFVPVSIQSGDRDSTEVKMLC